VSDRVLVEEVIKIDAPREVVFELLTSAQGLLTWIAVEAECEAVPGGVIRWRHQNGAIMSGRFVVIERPSRVVFTYGWERGAVDVPPGSTRVDIELEEHGGVTQLRLVHSQLPTGVADEHRHGWQWFLGRLAERSAGGAERGGCPLERTERAP
jgi:uncharacterized protein YndB with AHSA1/START domain